MLKCSTEDRLAIEDLTVAYCSAVDAIGDIDGVCAVFTADAVYDLTGLGMAELHGHDAIRAFFAQAFPTMAHNAHCISNFALTGHTGNTASARAYVHAVSTGIDGSSMDVKARYFFDVVRCTDGWKISRLGFKPFG